MTITTELPPDLDPTSVHNMQQEAREAIAVRLFNEEKLSHGGVAKYLGIARGEVDRLLGRHGRVDDFSATEIAEQAESLQIARRNALTKK